MRYSNKKPAGKQKIRKKPSYHENKNHEKPQVRDYYITKFGNTYQPHIEVVWDTHDHQFNPETANCYLAHSIRALEILWRKLYGNQFFRIICRPFPESADETKNIGAGLAGEYEEFYCIYFNRNLDGQQLHICISHELGHICGKLFHDRNGEAHTDDEKEIFADLYGFMILLDKYYYYSFGMKDYKPSKWTVLIDNYKHMKDHNFGILSP
jgi:hypothetical protein